MNTQMDKETAIIYAIKKEFDNRLKEKKDNFKNLTVPEILKNNDNIEDINVENVENHIKVKSVCYIKNVGTFIFLPDGKYSIIPVRVTHKYEIDNTLDFINNFGEKAFYKIGEIKPKSLSQLQKTVKEDILKILGEINLRQAVYPNTANIKNITNKEMQDYINNSFLKDFVKIYQQTNEYYYLEQIINVLNSKYQELKIKIKEDLLENKKYNFFVLRTSRTFKISKNFQNLVYSDVLKELNKFFPKENPNFIFNLMFDIKPSSSSLRELLKDNSIKDKELNKIGVIKKPIYSFMNSININNNQDIKKFKEAVKNIADIADAKNNPYSAMKFDFKEKNTAKSMKFNVHSIPSYS